MIHKILGGQNAKYLLLAVCALGIAAGLTGFSARPVYALPDSAAGQPHPGTRPLNTGEAAAFDTCKGNGDGPWGAIWVNNTTGDTANTATSSGYYAPNVTITGAPQVDSSGTKTTSTSPKQQVYVRGSVYNCSSNSAVSKLAMKETYAISVEMVNNANAGNPPTAGDKSGVNVTGVSPFPATTGGLFPENGSGIQNIGYIPSATRQPPSGPYFSRGTIANRTSGTSWSNVGRSLSGMLSTANLSVTNNPGGGADAKTTVYIWRCFGYLGNNNSNKYGTFGIYNCATQTIGVTIHWTQTPNHAPTGTVTSSCTLNSSNNDVYSAVGKFTDSDGKSSAPAKGVLAIYTGVSSTGVAQYSPITGVVLAPSPYKTGTVTWSGTWPSGHAIYLLDYDVSSSGAYSLPAKVLGGVARPSCPPVPATPTCGDFAVLAATLNDTDPQPNEAYTVTARILYKTTAGASATLGDSYHLTVNGVTVAGRPTLSGLYIVVPFSLPGIAATGNYNFKFTETGVQNYTVPTPYPDADCAVQVANKPYVQVFSGDVQAGVEVPITAPPYCAAVNSDGGISAWNSDNQGTGYAGAGGKFGVEAMAVIEGFASAQGPRPSGSGLSFANTAAIGTRPSGDNFGGSFGGGSSDGCDTSITSPNTPGNTLGAITVPAGQHLTKYFNGDVYITGNVVYNNAWGSVAAIPSMKVVAINGNIYIGPGVTQLDGVYIAEDDGSGGKGTIYTCAPGGVAPDPLLDTTLFAACSTHQLAVNGSLIGNQIQLLRACGTVNQAGSADPTTYSGGSTAINCSASNHAAEVFNYGPTDWIGQSTANGSTMTSKWDAVVSLPPVL